MLRLCHGFDRLSRRSWNIPYQCIFEQYIFTKAVNDIILLFVCLLIFASLEKFSLYMETSPSPMKDCKFRPLLGTHYFMHWAVRFFSLSHSLRHEAICKVISEGLRYSHLSYQSLASELSVQLLKTNVWSVTW